jgi:hypothetical protein
VKKSSKTTAPEVGAKSTGWRGLPEICTVKELAANFGCSTSVIYRAIYAEDVEAWSGLLAGKENGRWIVRRIEAARWFYAPIREALTSLLKSR